MSPRWKPRDGGDSFFLAAQAPAEVFRLGRWDGAIEGVVDFFRQDIGRGSVEQTRFESTFTEERLTLRNVGAYFFDPRLINLSLGGTFGLSQEWLTTESGTEFRDGTLQGYDAFASVLPEQTMSLNLFANREQFFLSRELAGRTEVETENRGITLFAKRLHIPSKLTFRQEFQEEKSRTGDIATRREEQLNRITYEGLRGWIDSEMDLRYEFVDFSDEVFPDLSYQSHEGSIYYSLDFGTELNRRWDSRLFAFTRSGASDLTTLTADELLRVDHTERLRTEYRYLLRYTDTLGDATTTQTGVFTLSHRLFENFTTTFELDGTYETLPGGEKQIYGGRLDFEYTKRLPRDGRLIADLGGSFEYEDDRFDTTETFVPQETHTAATPFALPIRLRNPFVITSTVVVTKVALGPLPGGCAPFPVPQILTEAVDYTLRTVGDTTEIVPLPCSLTNPGINPGDTIAVDYWFSVSPSLTFTTGTWYVNISADYRWIRPYFIHEQSDQSLLSGRDDRFLDDERSDTIGTELRYDGKRLRASLVGEAERFRSGDLAFDEIRSKQSLGIPILAEMTLAMSGNQTFTDFSRPEGRETRALTGQATLTYTFNTSLTAETYAEIRDLNDTLVEDERTIEAGLRVRWFFRRVEMSPTLTYTNRQRGDTDTDEYRANFRIIRRF